MKKWGESNLIFYLQDFQPSDFSVGLPSALSDYEAFHFHCIALHITGQSVLTVMIVLSPLYLPTQCAVGVTTRSDFDSALQSIKYGYNSKGTAWTKPYSLLFS
jgi:hypothetical protein